MAEYSSLDESDIADDLLDLIPRLLREIRADIPREANTEQVIPELRDISELRATTGQIRLLRIVITHQRCTMPELAEQLDVAAPTVTAMVKMLCTLLHPTSGRAWINGYDIERQASQVRQSIGIVFQDPTLDEYLTAEQNLYYHCMIYHTPRKTRDTRIREVLQLVGLDERRKDIVKTFSGGMKRRLEVARGLLHEPQTLFLDEPTVGLDPQTRRSVWEHVLRLRERTGLTIFMTTHYMEEAEYCDRIAIIDHGQIVALDTPAALKRMVGQDLVCLTTSEPERAATMLEQHTGRPVRRED